MKLGKNINVEKMRLNNEDKKKTIKTPCFG